MTERVELRPAYAWDCPECGREHFVRAIVPEMSPEEIKELRDGFGLEPWETGDFLCAPERVTCTHCQIEFETENFNDGEED